MGVFALLCIREIALVIGGIFLIVIDHQGWAAVLLFFYLMVLIQSFNIGNAGGIKNDKKDD